MEMKKMSVEQSVKLIVLILVIVAKGSASLSLTDSFTLCFGKCMFPYVLTPVVNVPRAVQCVVTCYQIYSKKKLAAKKIFYCNLGCATDLCAEYGNGIFLSFFLLVNRSKNNNNIIKLYTIVYL